MLRLATVFHRQRTGFGNGLNYFGARYYSGIIARWTEPDPKNIAIRHLINPQKLDKYTYVLENPLKLIDPDGLEEFIIVVSRQINQHIVVMPPVMGDGGQKDSHRIQQTATIETDKSKNNGNPLVSSSQKAGVSAGLSIGPNTVAPPGWPIGVGVGVAEMKSQDGNNISAHTASNGDVAGNFTANAKYPNMPGFMEPAITQDITVTAHTWPDGSTTFSAGGDYSVFPGLSITVQQSGGDTQTLYTYGADDWMLNRIGPSSLLCPDMFCGKSIPAGQPGVTFQPSGEEEEE